MLPYMRLALPRPTCRAAEAAYCNLICCSTVALRGQDPAGKALDFGFFQVLRPLGLPSRLEFCGLGLHLGRMLRLHIRPSLLHRLARLFRGLLRGKLLPQVLLVLLFLLHGLLLLLRLRLLLLPELLQLLVLLCQRRLNSRVVRFLHLLQFPQPGGAL